MIRILVVDDSATAREHITAVLNSDPEIEVVGKAKDGMEGVALAAELNPDAITMDINMPRLNGNEATKRIMETTPIPIIVVSSITRQEMMHEGFDILLSGALEIVRKPSTITAQGYRTITEELLAKVKAISQIKFQRVSA